MPDSGASRLSAAAEEQIVLTKILAHFEAANNVPFTGEIPPILGNHAAVLAAIKANVESRQAVVIASQQPSPASAPAPYSAGEGAKFLYTLTQRLTNPVIDFTLLLRDNGVPDNIQTFARAILDANVAAGEGVLTLASGAYYSEAQLAATQAAERAELEAINSKINDGGPAFPTEETRRLQPAINDRLAALTNGTPYNPAHAFATFSFLSSEFNGGKGVYDRQARGLADDDHSGGAENIRALQTKVGTLLTMSQSAPDKLFATLTSEQPAAVINPRAEELAHLTTLRDKLEAVIGGNALDVGGEEVSLTITNADAVSVAAHNHVEREYGSYIDWLKRVRTEINGRLTQLESQGEAGYKPAETAEFRNALDEEFGVVAETIEHNRDTFAHGEPSVMAGVRNAFDKITKVHTRLHEIAAPVRAADLDPAAPALTLEQEQNGLGDLLIAVRAAASGYEHSTTPDNDKAEYAAFLNGVGNRIETRLQTIGAPDHNHSAADAAAFQEELRTTFIEKGEQLQAEHQADPSRRRTLGFLMATNDELLAKVDALGAPVASDASHSRLKRIGNYFRNNWKPIVATAGVTFALKTAFVAAATIATVPMAWAIPTGAVVANVCVRLFKDARKHRQAQAAALAAGAAPLPNRSWKDTSRSIVAGVVIGLVGYGIGAALSYTFESLFPDAVDSIRQGVQHALGGSADPAGTVNPPAPIGSPLGTGTDGTPLNLPAPPAVAPPAVNPIDALRAEVQAHVDAGDFDGLKENGLDVKAEIIKTLANGDDNHLVNRLAGAGYLDFNGTSGNGALDVSHQILGAKFYGLAQRFAEAVNLDGTAHPIRGSLQKSVEYLSKIALFAPALKP